jgi:hypothetical protein
MSTRDLGRAFGFVSSPPPLTPIAVKTLALPALCPMPNGADHNALAQHAI